MLRSSGRCYIFCGSAFLSCIVLSSSNFSMSSPTSIGGISASAEVESLLQVVRDVQTARVRSVFSSAIQLYHESAQRCVFLVHHR